MDYNFYIHCFSSCHLYCMIYLILFQLNVSVFLCIKYIFLVFQVLLAMKANVEDRGIKGDCTPLMEAASGGYVDIVKLLIAHGADVNAQSSAGKC